MAYELSTAEIADRLSYRVARLGQIVVADRRYVGSSDEIADLEAYESACQTLNRPNDRAHAAWIRSFLLVNRGDRSQAESAIVAIRTDRDILRQRSRELGFKASLTGAFPALATRLAALRGAERPEDLFDAIEWAKGRALNDRREGQDVARLAELQQALRGRRTHYLTFLSDDKNMAFPFDDRAIYSVLVRSDGMVSADVASIPGATFHKLTREGMIRPDGRNAITEDLLDAQLDWLEVLAPLMSLVTEAWESRHIRAGDTLLISPHSRLHLFPLHELAIAGVPAGIRLPVARVSSAAEVVRLLADPPRTVVRATAFRAPKASEADDPGHLAAFARVRRSLPASRLESIDTVDRVDATRERLLAALGPNMLVHLMTHGDFLERGPYLLRSFLNLATGGVLPSGSISQAVPADALTVADLVRLSGARAGQPLLGTHVTLQACVSGFASANPQGDSVGLEWAFLLAGAASTLGTHWHVNWPVASLFSAAFYRAWLGTGQTRAAAWHQAGRIVRRIYPGAQWAAFSLTGDWR